MAVRVLFIDAEDGFEGNLGLADSSQADKNGPLAIILVRVRGDSLKKLL
jgi:hypothetical protein